MLPAKIDLGAALSLPDRLICVTSSCQHPVASRLANESPDERGGTVRDEEKHGVIVEAR